MNNQAFVVELKEMISALGQKYDALYDVFEVAYQLCIDGGAEEYSERVQEILREIKVDKEQAHGFCLK